MYKNGSFVDFQGVTRQFIVCALSTSSFNNESDCTELTCSTNGLLEGAMILPRAVFIGVSVCNPIDEWDEERGKMIALSKAKGFKLTAPEKSAALFATRAGLISEIMVQALLVKEVEHVAADPGSVIKGYNQMKARWEKEQSKKKFLEETPQELMDLGSRLSTLKEEEIGRVISVALIKANE